MSELPALLSDAVGEVTVIDTVDVGGGDAIAVTTEATYLYRSEGLLRDESVETFDHAVDRLSVRTKRRKSSIKLETMDGEAAFTVPSDIVDTVVEAMMEGVLLTTGVVAPDEELLALFRFSELTVVVTDRRLFEHVGSAVWGGEFETVDYANLIGLDFERGSVATQVVLETGDRRRRVKVPNEHAGTVRRRIQTAILEFHDVASIEAFRAEHADADGDGDQAASRTEGDHDGRPEANGSDTERDRASGDDAAAGWSPPADRDPAGSVYQQGTGGSQASAASGSDGDAEGDGRADGPAAALSEDIGALEERVDALSGRIERQTERIESQQELLEQLVDELRRGR